VWTCDIQVGVTTIIGMSSRHHPCVAIEEMLEGTRGCSVARSDTARSGFYIPRAPNQDFG
jgi:MOSC domain-containing protein YiiM